MSGTARHGDAPLAGLTASEGIVQLMTSTGAPGKTVAGCNYDCEHGYLRLKKFAGLSWPERERLLRGLPPSGA
jgi:hypothetical protein